MRLVCRTHTGRTVLGYIESSRVQFYRNDELQVFGNWTRPLAQKRPRTRSAHCVPRALCQPLHSLVRFVSWVHVGGAPCADVLSRFWKSLTFKSSVFSESRTSIFTKSTFLTCTKHPAYKLHSLRGMCALSTAAQCNAAGAMSASGWCPVCRWARLTLGKLKSKRSVFSES